MRITKYRGHALRSRRAQRGSVLLWGMVILLTLTIMVITAARMGITDTRIAGNEMFSMMAYQGAESALERVSTLFHVDRTASAADTTESWDFVDPVNNNSGNLNSTGAMSLKGHMMCTPQNGYAMSVEMNPDPGSVSCLLFHVDASANLAGTGARSEHVQGIMKYVPANGHAVR